MYSNAKLHIYKGVIQYFLESTHYTLKRIAILTNSTISKIRSIYHYDQIPPDFTEERHLVHLFQIVLELERKNNLHSH